MLLMALRNLQQQAQSTPGHDDADALMASSLHAEQVFAAASSSSPVSSDPPTPTPAAASHVDPWWTSAQSAEKRPHHEVVVPPLPKSPPPSPGILNFVTKGELKEGLSKLSDKLQATIQNTMANLNCDLSTNFNWQADGSTTCHC